jgi:hypothetical protein
MKSAWLPFAMVMAAAALRAASPWMYVSVVLFFLAVMLVAVFHARAARQPAGYGGGAAE